MAGRSKQPQQVGNVVSALLAQRGYGHVQAAAGAETAWREAVGAELARHCRVGAVRKGVLTVTVRNSAVLQELTFCKSQILTKLAARLPGRRIVDCRFRVGQID